VRRGLDLVQHRPAVVALELRVVGQRRLRAGRVEPQLAVHQDLEERTRRVLPRAVHVRNAVRTEALRPVVPARGLRGVDERQGGGAVLRRAFLVQVDLHARHTRLPAQLQQQSRVVERTRRGVDHVSLDAAVLAGIEGLHAPFDEAVLAQQALPALAGAYPRGTDASARTAPALARGAVGARAIPGARNPQIGGQRHVLALVAETVGEGRV